MADEIQKAIQRSYSITTNVGEKIEIKMTDEEKITERVYKVRTHEGEIIA